MAFTTAYFVLLSGLCGLLCGHFYITTHRTLKWDCETPILYLNYHKIVFLTFGMEKVLSYLFYVIH